MRNWPTEEVKHVIGLPPAADFLAGTKNSDVVSLANYQRALIVVNRGAGSTGTQVLKVQACDNFTPSNTTDIPFVYRRRASGDTYGDRTAVAAAGLTTVAGGDDTYYIEVDQADLPEGKPNLRLNSVEGVDAAVVGHCDIWLFGPRYEGTTMPTAIA